MFDDLLYTYFADCDLTKTAKSRREVRLTMDGRSALLTLWGERAEQLSMVLGATYTIMAVKAANEFKGQRAYNSTSSTYSYLNGILCIKSTFIFKVKWC